MKPVIPFALFFLYFSSIIQGFSINIFRPPVFEITEAQDFVFVKKFFTALMNPNDREEARKINSTFFTDDCRGRVSVTRDFEGVELNSEYIFGLFSGITQVDFLMIGITKNFTVTNYVSRGNTVAASAIIDFVIEKLNFTIPVQVDLWFLLDALKDGSLKISQYDAVFRNFERAYQITNRVTQTALKKAFPDSDKSGEELMKTAAILSICKVHQENCANTQYSQYESFEQCVGFLSTKRLGASFEGGRDTIFCRNIHQVMLPFRPSVHCNHIGPSGGEMCTDADTDYFSVINSYQGYFKKPFINIGGQQQNKHAVEQY